MGEAKTAIRHYRRTHAWDYARGASLFITIAVSPRRSLFGRVEGARVELSELGRIVDGALAAMPRLRRAVALGCVILSGFVSPGEKAVRDWLGREMQARFIRILPSAIPNARYKPESRSVEAFAAGRSLEIAKGNGEVEFSRGACLDYNAEIVEMARASAGGYALYLTERGLKLQHANGERAT